MWPAHEPAEGKGMRNGRVQGQMEGEDGGREREGDAQAPSESGYKAKSASETTGGQWRRRRRRVRVWVRVRALEMGDLLPIRHTSCGPRFLERMTVPRCAIHVPPTPSFFGSLPAADPSRPTLVFSYVIVQQPPTANTPLKYHPTAMSVRLSKYPG